MFVYKCTIVFVYNCTLYTFVLLASDNIPHRGHQSDLLRIRQHLRMLGYTNYDMSTHKYKYSTFMYCNTPNNL